MRTHPLYDTVIPATLEFSQPMAKKNRDRTKPSRDVPKANLAAPIKPSLYFFMTRPPENIPRATAGMLITPEQRKKGHQWTTSCSNTAKVAFQLPLVHVSHKTSGAVKDESSFKCFDVDNISHRPTSAWEIWAITVSYSISLTSCWSYQHLSNAAFFHFSLSNESRYTGVSLWCTDAHTVGGAWKFHQSWLMKHLLPPACSHQFASLNSWMWQHRPQQASDTQKREVVQRNPIPWIRHVQIKLCSPMRKFAVDADWP